jgi:uncharacterized protein
MIVVSDATPISTLLKADQATLLQKLFDVVIIPEAVFEELLAFHAELPDFVRVQPVSARNHRLQGTENLGKGEAEAIQLAKEIGADILLTDETKSFAAIDLCALVPWLTRSIAARSLASPLPLSRYSART